MTQEITVAELGDQHLMNTITVHHTASDASGNEVMVATTGALSGFQSVHGRPEVMLSVGGFMAWARPDGQVFIHDDRNNLIRSLMPAEYVESAHVNNITVNVADPAVVDPGDTQ